MQVQKISELAGEMSQALGQFAVEAYYDEIENVDNVDIVGVLGSDYLEETANAVSAAVQPPVICGPELKSRIAEQWTAYNAYGRQVMEEATIFERIAAIDAQVVALMTERAVLASDREKRKELLREEELRQKKLREAYGINQQIAAETADIQSQIEKSRASSFSISGSTRQHPTLAPRLSMIEELRQKRSKAATSKPSTPSAGTPVTPLRKAQPKDRAPQQEHPQFPQRPEPEAEDYDMDDDFLLSVSEQNTQSELISSMRAEDNPGPEEDRAT